MIAAIGLTSAIAGCGTLPPPKGGSSGASASSGGSPSSGATNGSIPSPSTTARGRPDDPTIAVTLRTYAAGDPCASLATTTDLPLAAPPCQEGWATYSAPHIPGQDLLAKEGVPTTATAAANVDRAAAQAMATAFLRTEGFQLGGRQTTSPR